MPQTIFSTRLEQLKEEEKRHWGSLDFMENMEGLKTIMWKEA
jgi:hypothetical protein